ncbi:MAG: hypothetical protein QM785_12245 [Pyrinomonadaceae bacterium]
MKKALYLVVIVLSFTVTAFTQKLGKPTQTSVPATAAQQKIIDEAIALHDAKKYDEAIAKYRSILTESPDCTMALYELSLSLQGKGAKLEAVETAYRGAKYISNELPLFYVLIANNLDDYGKPDEAVHIYLDGLKALDGDSRFNGYRSSLYYNLAITYYKQKKINDARTALKSAVEGDFGYASPHYLLSVVYNGSRYNIPAVLAAARLVALEYNTARTKNSVDLIFAAIEPTRNEKTGNITINLDFNAPKDEGDFTMADIILPTLTTIDEKKDGKKSTNEKFIGAIDSIISMLDEDKKLKSSFVGKTYIPYLADLKKAGHVEAFANMLLYIRNNQNADAAKWVGDNGPKLQQFLSWAKGYRLNAK